MSQKYVRLQLIPPDAAKLEQIKAWHALDGDAPTLRSVIRQWEPPTGETYRPPAAVFQVLRYWLQIMRKRIEDKNKAEYIKSLDVISFLDHYGENQS